MPLVSICFSFLFPFSLLAHVLYGEAHAQGACGRIQVLVGPYLSDSQYPFLLSQPHVTAEG